MNNVSLIGNMTREPELKYTTGAESKARLSFTLAVNREFSKDKKADFIDCVAWGKTAEIIATYTPKGKPLGITGRIEKRQYENQEGRTIYITEVVVDRAQLLGSQTAEKTQEYEFTDLQEVNEADIPF